MRQEGSGEINNFPLRSLLAMQVFFWIKQILRYAKEMKNCLKSEFSEKILSIFLGLVIGFYLFIYFCRASYEKLIIVDVIWNSWIVDNV